MSRLVHLSGMKQSAGTPTKSKKINLALQGGGTHGAYAWGVLDKILEDGRLDIEGVSATSAGTMNACALAYGLHQGGRDGARAALHDLWENIYKAGRIYSPVRRTLWDRLMFPGSGHSLSFAVFDILSHAFSPYQFNPFDVNPLKEIMSESIDFGALRSCSCVRIFVSATHVASGRVRVFKTDEITLDVVMASAALPEVFKAVEIDGEHYWDGGYVGNPSLFPLFYYTECRDIMIVHINPIDRQRLPKTATEIMNRVNEISFNAALLQEIRAIGFVQRLLEQDMLRPEYKERYKNILLHSIRSDQVFCGYSVASKFDTDWQFLTSLRDQGREIMGAWLDRHYDEVGKVSTVDVRRDFL